MDTPQADWQRRIQDSVAAALELAEGLSDVQLNWRPSPDDWSIAQQIEHLTIVTGRVGEKIEEALAGPVAAPGAASWRPGFLERRFIAAVGPQPAGRSVPVPKLFLPGDGPFESPDLCARFEETHRRFQALIERSSTVDLGRVKAASAALPLLRISLGGWFEAMAVHLAYHVGRAAAIRRKVDFPR